MKLKRSLLKESLVATVLTIVITGIVSQIPYSLEFAKGLHQGFSDFDIYDLYYANRHAANVIENKDIVIVQIGDTRNDIADQISELRRYRPRVIGIDATFDTRRDSASDEALAQVLQDKQDIVLAYYFDENKRKVQNAFSNSDKATPEGFIDFSKHPDYTVVRTYSPFLKVEGKQEEAFTTSLLRKIDPDAYSRLKRRRNNVEIINYSGNLNNFLKLSQADLLSMDSLQLDDVLRNRVVLLGYYIDRPPLVMEDLRFTPLNEQVAGKGFPDMYGVVVHANILAMLLSGNFAHLASKLISFLFAFSITFFMNWFFISRYYRKTHPSHGWLMLLQFLLILLVLFFSLMLYNYFLYKVRLEPIMIAMVISLELLGLYKSFALWLHKRYHYQTVFTHKRII